MCARQKWRNDLFETRNKLLNRKQAEVNNVNQKKIDRLHEFFNRELTTSDKILMLKKLQKTRSEVNNFEFIRSYMDDNMRIKAKKQPKKQRVIENYLEWYIEKYWNKNQNHDNNVHEKNQNNGTNNATSSAKSNIQKSASENVTTFKSGSVYNNINNFTEEQKSPVKKVQSVSSTNQPSAVTNAERNLEESPQDSE